MGVYLEGLTAIAPTELVQNIVAKRATNRTIRRQAERMKPAMTTCTVNPTTFRNLMYLTKHKMANFRTPPNRK